MRLFQNLDTNEFQTDRSFGQAITALKGRLYTSLRLEIGFTRAGAANTLDLGTDPEIAWLLKRDTGSNKYDAAQLNSAVTFTRFTETNANGGTDYFYAGNLDLGTPVFEKLLGVDHRTSLETFTVTCVADVASNLHGKYFTVYKADASALHIQLTTSGTPTAPSGGTTTLVTIAANATATTIAAAIVSALSASTEYTVTNVLGVLTFTAKAYGARGYHDSGTSGFAITLTTCGMSAMSTTDIASVTLLSEISYEHEGQIQIGSIFNLTLQNCLRRPGAASPSTTGISSAQIIQYLPDVVGYTGGGTTKLDGLATAALTAGRIFAFVHSTDGLVHYQLRAGTTAEASPGIIRPDDYAATTNEKIWVSV